MFDPKTKKNVFFNNFGPRPPTTIFFFFFLSSLFIFKLFFIQELFHSFNNTVHDHNPILVWLMSHADTQFVFFFFFV